MSEFYPQWQRDFDFFQCQAKREGLTFKEFLEKHKLKDPRAFKENYEKQEICD